MPLIAGERLTARERAAELITPEFIIALILLATFVTAYFVYPSREMAGALIMAFAGAWSFYLGNAVGQARAQRQAGDATALTGAAVRGLSAALSERTASPQSSEVQEQ